MENASTKLLESATHRTLHAHAFSRTSTQASLVLTDLLSRYLALLSATCAKYAAHAGRTSLCVHDAIGALEELGVSVDELNEYVGGEGKEMSRYAIWSGRRVEDLNEFKAQLRDGLRQDRDDAIPLVYAPCAQPDEGDIEEEEEEEASDEKVAQIGNDAEPVSIADTMVTLALPRPTTPPRISTPPLPLSPISNPSSPSHPRKRARKASWQPPDHIPDFLPPFPTIAPEAPTETSPTTDSPLLTQVAFEMPAPLPLPAEAAKVEKATAATTLTSTSASDYLVQIPYSQSTLSQVAEWHLPSAPPRDSRVVPSRTPARAPLPTPQTEPALFSAYHHILTHPPPPNGAHPTLSRHKVAMALVGQTQSLPRWDPPDTLYSSVGPCAPRVASIGPTYAMGLGDEGKTREGKEKEFKFPPTLPRAVAPTERLTLLVSQQGSRIPDLARNVLPATILSRTSRLTHPPPLQRGPKLLVYGGGVPAPWNANALPAAGEVPGTPAVGSRAKDSKDKDEGPVKATLPDARLYATWECEVKDFRVPLVTRGRGRMGSVAGGSGGQLSRNTSVISSSSSSSSSTSSLLSSSDKTHKLALPVPIRPTRTFAAPRCASDFAQSKSQAHLLPSYIQRELGITGVASAPPSSPLRDTIAVNSGPPRAKFSSPQDFDFGEILGHGSYSTVIQAKGKRSGRVYAIKVLDKAHLQRHNQRRTAYAEKEALVLLGLTHPGVVGLHATFSDAWSLYFVLDLLPNGDLRALISRYGSLSLECTRYYIAQLTDTLAYIHSKGVMHRDIKPENLLLDSSFRLALADFGTAKVLPPLSPDSSSPSNPDTSHADTIQGNGTPLPQPNTDTPSMPTLRRSNTFVGTPQYYSPELLAHSLTSTASDLWALGCVLFELHTGSFAFHAPSPLLTWRLIKALEYTFPDGFDADARDLVTKLLVTEPEKRLGAGGVNGMRELKAHPFFKTVNWKMIWEVPHPPLKSGLKAPPEPVAAPESDAELGAQLREERLLDQDDDEIAWAKDARIAAYLPGLRHADANGNGNGAPAVDVHDSSSEEGEQNAASGDMQQYSFPLVAGGEADGGLSYSFPPAVSAPAPTASANNVAMALAGEEPKELELDSRLAEAAAGLALDQPISLDAVESSSRSDLVAKVETIAAEKGEHKALKVNGEASGPIAARPSSLTPPPLFAAALAPLSAPPPPPHIPTPAEFAQLLHSAESLLLSSPLVPEAPAPNFARLLPRLLSGSLRSKPKLKERVLLLTDRRVLCVNTGKTIATVKQEFALAPLGSVNGNGNGVGSPAAIVKGVEARDERGLALLTNDKPVVYVLGDTAAPAEWVKRIREILQPGEPVGSYSRT
ncbi:hypothetical protein D9615_007772 [Tricholomella constricta]|uniref:non-specific serine/threonine protein kinase n=1 Tax=Tricholomella constricta TaxID=117010 RepID=A0A8H5H3H7_9AGAR|nr:hypothetical protein D9615_007772 [Tricholomella constricta]